MATCRILIADDEHLARQAILLALPKNDDVVVVAECSDGTQAMEKIAQLLPDVLFLDIQMPAGGGFEVIGQLPPGYHPYIIMVSAHDQAVRAFEHNAGDYLLKPFTQERFDKAFDKAYAASMKGGPHATQATFQSLASRLEQLWPQTVRYKSRISIREGARIVVVNCDDIQYAEAAGDYSAIYTEGRKYLQHDTITYLESILDPGIFVRVHRSAIVNIKFVKELISHHNGDYTLMLHSGRTLKLSRSYRDQLMQMIG